MSAAPGYHARRSCLTVVAVGVLACSRGQAPRTDSADAPAASPPGGSPARGDSVGGKAAGPAGSSGAPGVVTINSSCVNQGLWQSCSLERRLIDAGFVLVKTGAAPTGVFPVGGTSYTLGTAELHVYLFATSKARETAIAAIDTVAIAPRGAVSSWPTAHTLITSNNLAAVLVSDNGRLVERVQNAITAGLPSVTH